jgi:hypothetical protein
MKRNFLLLLATASVIASRAQDSTLYRPHILDTRLISRQGRVKDGYLYAVSDTALLFSRERRRPLLYDTTATAGLQLISYRDLKFVTIHSRGGTGRTVLIGLFAGAATSAIIAYCTGDDPPGIFSYTAGQKAVIMGMVGGFVGALTGLIVGIASHRTFAINGKKERLNYMSRRLAIRMGL